MLPQSRRIRRADEFRSVVRSGRRAASRSVVVHVGPLAARAGEHGAADRVAHGRSAQPPARAGFIVGRSVARSAVVRNRVARRLRAVMAPRLDTLPDGIGVVVRALPPAAGASTRELDRDVALALRRCAPGLGQRPDPAREVSQ